MMASEIQGYADIGGVSQPDINLAAMLRNKIIPRFLHEVGYVSWRRKVVTIAISGAGRSYTLPAGCEMVESIVINGITPQVQYIGENPEAIMLAEGTTITAGKPTQYYLGYDQTTLEQNKFLFERTPDQAYNAIMTYYQSYAFVDNTTDFNMAAYVPFPYQWALVEGLKMEIFFIRFGIGDPRYIAAEQEYKQYVERCTENKERARRNNPVFGR